MLTRRILVAALVLVPQALVAQRAMQPNDWHRLTTVSQPAMSPDGKVVAFTVTTVNEKEKVNHKKKRVSMRNQKSFEISDFPVNCHLSILVFEL